MSAGNDLSIQQFRDGTASRVFGYNAAGEPALIGPYTGSNGIDVNGAFGYVPAPLVADYYKFLNGSGQWVAIAPGAAGKIPKSNGLGVFAESNLSEVNGALTLFQNGSSNIGFFALADSANGGRYGIIAATSAKERKMYDFVWVDTATNGGNSDINLLLGQDMVAMVEFRVVGIKTDGAEVYSCLKISTFKKDGAADPVLMNTQTVYEYISDGVENPSTTISVSGAGLIRIAYSCGVGSIDVYRWTVFAKVITTQV